MSGQNSKMSNVTETAKYCTNGQKTLIKAFNETQYALRDSYSCKSSVLKLEKIIK